MHEHCDDRGREPFDEPDRGRRHDFGGRRGHRAAAFALGMVGPGMVGPGQFGGPFGPGGPFGSGGPGRRAGRGQVRTSILALLAEAPLNGYQIMQSLAERTAGAWRPSPGTVYPTLSQLEDEGLIEAFDNDGQKAYRLTETGRQAADRIEQKPWDAVNEQLGGCNPHQVGSLWTEYGAMGGALKEFTRGATPGQLETATRLLTATRRKLYGLLAADDAGDPPVGGDVHNGDDLR